MANAPILLLAVMKVSGKVKESKKGDGGDSEKGARLVSTCARVTRRAPADWRPRGACPRLLSPSNPIQHHLIHPVYPRAAVASAEVECADALRSPPSFAIACARAVRWAPRWRAGEMACVLETE